MKKIDLAIIGSGPAGYTAAIYASRALLRTSLYTGIEIGGQLMYTTQVENFPGFTQGILGSDLMQNMLQQAEKFGTHIETQTVTAVEFSHQPFKLWTNLPSSMSTVNFSSITGQEYQQLAQEIKQSPPSTLAKAVIIATGATAMMLDVPGERELLGRGVSTCAVCDAAFFKDKKVFVVGGGDSAMEDALALSRFSQDVTIIHRRDSFRASKIMQQRVLNNKQIHILWNSEVVQVIGEKKLEAIQVKTQGNTQQLAANGLFLAIGHRPVSTVFKDQIILDQEGYVVTGQSSSQEGIVLAQKRIDDQNRVALPTMTSVDGVFAAGDVVDLHYKQAISAAGMGAGSALDAEAWLQQYA